MYKKNLTISEAFYYSVNRVPNRTAQLFNPDLYHGDNNGKFTWKELEERVRYIASGLLSLGLNKEERVSIMAPNSPYWSQIDAATINCGGVLVTIYPTLSLNEASYIVNDSESKYIFVGNEDILNRILPGIDNMPTIQKIIVIDLKYKSNDERIINLTELMELGKKDLNKNQKNYESRWKGNKLEDWATILYTSGTTGQGKGVILTHWCLSSRMDNTHAYFNESGHPLNEEDLVLSFLPLSHIFDRACSQWTAFWHGAAIAYADSPATLIEDLPKYNPTWFSCVPRLYERIYIQFQQQLEASAIKKKLFNWALKVGEEALQYRADQYGRYDMRQEFDLKTKLPLGLKTKYKIADKLFAKVRALFGNRFRFSFSASASISPELLKFYYILNVPVLEGYGLTETCSAATYNPMKAVTIGTVGPEANGSKVRLANDGEIEISGAGNFIGYLNKPEETAEAFTEDKWFKTGDIGVIDNNGYYRIVDRKKAIVCLATGKNVAPTKLEGFFATNLAVDQAFIIGDERNYISALIVPNFTYFIELFNKENIPYDKSKLEYTLIAGMQLCTQVGDDFISNPRLIELVEEAVQHANSNFEEFEVIRKYTIIKRRFTEETGELTPTQKTKKKVILDNYKDTIENMYKK